ncbi:lipid-A-disaccharide synthase-related protein [Parathermosynechococcus lividus]
MSASRRRLLCVSNGHGEDAIATAILQPLQQGCPEMEMTALPLVGEGLAYQRCGIPLLQTGKTLPSGGFIYMDWRQLWQDLRAGLVSLLGQQFDALQQWSKDGGHVLAVGDVVPLLFAYLSGCPYSFVGTAKSDYYLDGAAWWGAGWAGSDYLPWEQWLLRSRRCWGVFPRDSRTAQGLQRLGIAANDCGNPMLDLVMPPPEPSPFHPKTIVLLPGSRAPEAYRNWQLILNSLIPYADEAIVLLAAISPGLEIGVFEESLGQWQRVPSPLAAAQARQYGHLQLILSQQHFREFLHWADGGIALAGTATEQAVGLGKPVVTFAGQGPQFTRAFARRQQQLLGSSLYYLENPRDAMPTLYRIWQDATQRQQAYNNGVERMGRAGAGARIAHALLQRLSAV